MTRITRGALLDAIHQACREGLTSLGDNISTDHEAAHYGGATTSRIARIAGCRPNTILRRLHRLQQDGEVIRVGIQRRAYRWWPFNLLAQREL